MPDLPVMLKLAGKRCVIVGGGAVAARRAAALTASGASVRIIAPAVDKAVTPQLGEQVTWTQRTYQPGDVAGAALVVIATDDPAVNAAAADEARQAGALINRADDAEAGDITIPAHSHDGPLTVAVHTGGVSANLAAKLRRELSASIDPDIPRLLALVAPYRDQIRANLHDDAARREALRRLADDEALALLKASGEPAVHQRSRALIDPSG